MARTNFCKVCGWEGPETTNQKWVGTNHNLCSKCVEERQARADKALLDRANGLPYDPDDIPSRKLRPGMAALLALSMVGLSEGDR